MGAPLRILHAVVNMNRGGAETLIMNLYRNIDGSKVQFDFLTCKEGVFDSEIREMGGRVHRIPYVTDVGHFGYIKALNEFFASHSDYRIVHSHMNQMSGFVLRAAKKAGVPTRIAHSHNTSSEGGIAAKIYKSYAGKFVLPYSTHLLACSTEASKWLFENKANKAKVLKNGIECDRFAFSQSIREEVREEFDLTNNHFVVGHVGRFTQQKNHTFLIDMFAEFNHQHPKAVLLLVGDGPLREGIQEKVHHLNLEQKVKFLGIRGDISRLLQSFDVLAFPSLHEGLPVSLIEAQSSGLPCMISDVISREVDMGLNLIHYLPIDDKQKWVDRFVDFTKNKSIIRTVSSDQFAKNGYDIKKTAHATQDFYFSVMR